MPALRIWPIIPTPPNYRIKRLFLFLRLVLTVPEGPTGPNLEAVRARAWAGARVCERMCALPAPYCWRPPAYGMRVSFDRALPFFFVFLFFFQNITKHIHEEKKKKASVSTSPHQHPNVNNHSREPDCHLNKFGARAHSLCVFFLFFSFFFNGLMLSSHQFQQSLTTCSGV